MNSRHRSLPCLFRIFALGFVHWVRRPYVIGIWVICCWPTQFIRFIHSFNLFFSWKKNGMGNGNIREILIRFNNFFARKENYPVQNGERDWSGNDMIISQSQADVNGNEQFCYYQSRFFLLLTFLISCIHFLLHNFALSQYYFLRI